LRCFRCRAVRHRNRQHRQAAPYHLIKWSGVEACQIWDNGIASKPWPDGYKVVSKPIATFDAALAVKASLMKKGVCKI
jgi:hypothetical protein